MAKRKSMLPLLIIWFVGLILIGGIIFIGMSMDGGFVNPFGEKDGYRVGCNVNIDGDWLSSIDINSADCDKSTIDTCVVGGFLSIFDSKGVIALYSQGVERVDDSFEAPNFGSKDISISACVPMDTTSVTLKVFDKDGGLDDETVVQL